MNSIKIAKTLARLAKELVADDETTSFLADYHYKCRPDCTVEEVSRSNNSLEFNVILIEDRAQLNVKIETTDGDNGTLTIQWQFEHNFYKHSTFRPEVFPRSTDIHGADDVNRHLDALLNGLKITK